MGERRAWSTVGVLALCALGLTACASKADDPAEGAGRTAAVYASILDWMADQEPAVTAEDAPEPTMFVASRSEEQIDIDVQVAVVDALEPTVFVRFIDERAEAIDGDTDDKPVRDAGMLVGLGAVAPEGTTVEVYADRYRTADDVEAWVITLRRSGDVWELVGVPAGTEARPIPADT